MSLEEGKAFYARLIPLAKGKRLPDRSDPLEWITFDTVGPFGTHLALFRLLFESDIVPRVNDYPDAEMLTPKSFIVCEHERMRS